MTRWGLTVLTLLAATTSAGAQVQRGSYTYFDNGGHIAVRYWTQGQGPGGTGAIVAVPVPVRPNGCGHAFAIVSRLRVGESGCAGW